MSAIFKSSRDLEQLNVQVSGDTNTLVLFRIM